MRPKDLPTRLKEEGSDSKALSLDRPDVVIVLALEKGGCSHIQKLTEAWEIFQKDNEGVPTITQQEIIGDKLMVGCIIPSPNLDSSPGMGTVSLMLADIDLVCHKRGWQKVAIICHPDHIQLFQQQLEGLGLMVVESIPAL